MRTLILSVLIAAPAWANPKVNTRTVELTPEKVAAGAQLYRVCAPCHGVAGEGKPTIAARLSSKTFLEAIGDDQLVAIIEDGRPNTAMPSWKGVFSRPQIESIVAHLRKMTPTQPAKLDESPLHGDPQKGAALFKRSCALCHDPDQPAYRRWGTQITGGMFLTTASDGFLRYILRNGKSGTAMRPFKGDNPLPELNLSDRDVEDLIVYLRNRK